MSSVWNPDQYNRFAEQRRQPFFDLLDMVEPRRGMSVLDLGCGTGELTREMHLRLAARETLGVDRSESMLARCAEHAASGLRFERSDLVAALRGARSDLVFSNAALQWVDDHPRLFELLAGAVREGGQLAVQVPANHDHAAHRAADEVAGEEPFRSELEGYARRWPVLAPDEYSELLEDLGFPRQAVLLRVYPHRLPDRGSVLEWIAGTYLKPFEERLGAESFARFLATLRDRLQLRLRDKRPFFYPFKRILMWAQR